jgi:CheY-like chemotaxis protein
MVSMLVVDDDPSIRELVREVLEEEGYAVVGEAEHGGTALDRMRASTEPLLVLLGLHMPKVDGLQVLEAVAADPALASRHRIILVTAAQQRATTGRVAALRDQLDVPLVLKPFEISELLDAVEAAAAAMAQRQLDG